MFPFTTQGGANSTGYQISRSLRFRANNTAYLGRTFAALPTTRTKLYYHGWVKRGTLGVYQIFLTCYDGSSATASSIGFNGSDQLSVSFGGASAFNVDTSAVYRDTGAWYCIDVAIDTTQATAANRVLVWVNGVAVTSFAATNYPALNATHQFLYNNANNTIGALYNHTGPSDFYTADTFVIDGSTMTPSVFGQSDPTTGVWSPITPTGLTYGTNGFHLDFSDNSTTTNVALDRSGNGNNWTPSGISVTAGVTNDSLTDSPTSFGADSGSTTDNARGNYGTLSPLDKGGVPVLSEANTKLGTGTTGWNSARSTLWVPSAGHWFFEATVVNATNGVIVGVSGATNCATYPGFSSTDTTAVGYAQTAQKYTSGGGAAYGSTYATGDVIGCEINAGSVFFYKNGVIQNGGTAALTGVTGDIAPHLAAFNNGADTLVLNCGQRGFAYAPPSGAKALCTQNLSAPAIVKPNQYMDISLYAGDATTPRSLSNAGFQPDLVWIKTRSAVRAHTLFDSVRTFAALKEWSSDQTYAEGGASTNLYGYVSSALSNGFQVTSGSSGADYVNKSGDTYTAWQWKKGATPGFDIQIYTGTGANRTVSHSLGVAPTFMLVKARTGVTQPGIVWHSSLPAANYLNIQGSGATAADTTVWNSTAPTSAVFSVGTNTATNSASGTYVTYLFTDVPGFSKFGSYAGNGSADGPFVYCGFRPKFVLVKEYTGTNAAASPWAINDTLRDPANVGANYLAPNLNNAEGSAVAVDLLSNGFKLRTTLQTWNESGGSAAYVFAAFAENPFKYARAR